MVQQVAGQVICGNHLQQQRHVRLVEQEIHRGNMLNGGSPAAAQGACLDADA